MLDGAARVFRSTRILVIAATLLTAASVIVWASNVARTGLGLRVTTSDGSLLAAFQHTALGPFRIDALAALQLHPAGASWSGYWNVPEPGFTELVFKSDGEARVELDGELLLGTGTDASLTNRLQRRITPGPHRLSVTYRRSGDATTVRRAIFLKGVTGDGRSAAVERRNTSPRAPSSGERAIAFAERILPIGALLAWALLLVQTIMNGNRAHLWKRVPVIALCVVTLLAGALRLESLVIRYWGADAPAWAEAMAIDIRDLRPGAFEHTPYHEAYGGDPFSYLTIARSMGGFYEPSSREPLFPALTRLALWLAADHDIGINFLSAFGSTLTCCSIFALGARLLSPWSGLLAALLWAIEWQVISFSVEGWRDDLFTLQVAAGAVALISLQLRPTQARAALLGVIGGLTLLTRLSALTFLLPGLLAAVLLPSSASRRERGKSAGVALAVMALLAGPFMIACALAFGDPFYAVNVHARFYSGRAGLDASGGTSALQFLARSRLPWEFVETGFFGLTSFPFLNKWHGFGAWLPGLGEAVRCLALAGLPVILFRPGGVLTLTVLFSSIAPYAWTWGIPGGGEWRFTLPAYPFYLVSAAMAVEALLRFVSRVLNAQSRRSILRPALKYAVAATVLLSLTPWVHQRLDWLRVGEAIRHERQALIEAGPAARLFFESGFRLIESETGSRSLEMRDAEARVRLPVDAGRAVSAVFRFGAAGPTGAPFEVWAGEALLVQSSQMRDEGKTATFKVKAEHQRSNGVLELRLVRLPSIGTSPINVLWVRVDP